MLNSHKNQIKLEEIQLARTLGIPEVVLLGVGALLGGGIFTLLGSAAGLAGGGLVFAMLLGSGIAFINLNAYVALATTFPQAGGGYHWVKEGLGDLAGFLSGWCSWMASIVACSLYAVSFGYFLHEFVFDFLGFTEGTLFNPAMWKICFSVGIVVLFGLVNYRGVSLSGKVGGAIALTILGILGLYIAYGAKHIALEPTLAVFNFSPLLPMGIAGILQAAALFYIAFEGSEIQAQTGEEVENPAKVLKIGLFASWAIVSVLYIFIALVLVGTTNGEGAPSWMMLGEASERAIIISAGQIMPFGYIVMLLGGLLANIAALNATIYSSSRILFSLGRDKLVFSGLGIMHPINYVPTRALLVSLALIIVVVTVFPLHDIASAADMLFIVLFMLLNYAYIELRRQKPEAKWKYVVPLEPYLPMLAIVLYALLGVALFHVSQLAIYFLLAWLLLGLVNYFAYAKRVLREDQEREVVYEHSTRFHPKSEYRVVLPVGADSDWHAFAHIAAAMTKEEGGDLMALRIHETKAGDDPQHAYHSTKHKRILEEIEEDMASKKLNIDTRIMTSPSVSEAILETIRSENADLALLSWDGDVNTKGFIFGRKIDVVLHRAKCDLLTVKTGEDAKMERVFIPVAVDGNPNLRFTGKVATALCHSFDSRITVVMVVPEDVRGAKSEKYYLQLLEERLRELKIKTPEQVETKLVYSDYLASGILKASSGYDVVLLPAARARITLAVGVGSIPEQVAKNTRRKTVMIAKGYRGIAQPFWEYVREWF